LKDFVISINKEIHSSRSFVLQDQHRGLGLEVKPVLHVVPHAKEVDVPPSKSDWIR